MRVNPTIRIPKDASRADRIVVFVHGINGSAKTWTKEIGRGSKVVRISWPDTLLQESSLGLGAVATLEYHTRFCAENLPLEIIAQKTLAALEREVFPHYKEVALVAHSMGGLISRRVAIALSQRRDSVGMSHFSQLRAILTLGTSVYGADIARVGSSACGSQHLVDLSSIEGNSYLRALEHDVRQLRRNPPSDKRRPLFYGAVEGKSTRLLGFVPYVIVSKQRAITCFDDSLVVFHDANHSGLTSIRDTADAKHRWLVEHLRIAFGKVSQNASQDCALPIPEPYRRIRLTFGTRLTQIQQLRGDRLAGSKPEQKTPVLDVTWLWKCKQSVVCFDQHVSVERSNSEITGIATVQSRKTVRYSPLALRLSRTTGSTLVLRIGAVSTRVNGPEAATFMGEFGEIDVDLPLVHVRRRALRLVVASRYEEYRAGPFLKRRNAWVLAPLSVGVRIAP